MSSVTAWAQANDVVGLDRRQLRRLRRRLAAARRASTTCDTCGGTLTHVAGPGLFRATWCTSCDADQLDAIRWYDEWLEHLEREHVTDTPDGL